MTWLQPKGSAVASNQSILSAINREVKGKLKIENNRSYGRL